MRKLNQCNAYRKEIQLVARGYLLSVVCYVHSEIKIYTELLFTTRVVKRDVLLTFLAIVKDLNNPSSTRTKCNSNYYCLCCSQQRFSHCLSVSMLFVVWPGLVNPVASPMEKFSVVTSHVYVNSFGVLAILEHCCLLTIFNLRTSLFPFCRCLVLLELVYVRVRTAIVILRKEYNCIIN